VGTDEHTCVLMSNLITNSRCLRINSVGSRQFGSYSLQTVTKTWLRKVHSDFSFDINGLDRIGRKGGIYVYVRDGIHAAVL
jgi:hypothetical protein